MKLYEIILKKKKDGKVDKDGHPVPHLFVATDAKAAKEKAVAAFPDYSVNRPNMIFDFSPR